MSATKKPAKTKAAKPATPAKGRKVEVVEMDQKILAAAKKEMARDDISNCQAMRNVAKRFGAARPIVLEKVFVEGLKMNKGTVRRQIQEGRAAAA
jgi:hypothetical protein